MWQVDYARFHQTVPVSEGVVSRDSAKRQAASRNDDDNDDTSTTTDDDQCQHTTTAFTCSSLPEYL